MTGFSSGTRVMFINNIRRTEDSTLTRLTTRYILLVIFKQNYPKGCEQEEYP
jgi:hypothetical protein